MVEKAVGPTKELRTKLFCLRCGEESGIPNVGVKWIDIRRKTSREGDFLNDN